MSFSFKPVALFLLITSCVFSARAADPGYLYQGITFSQGGIRIVATPPNYGYSGIRITTGSSAYSVSAVDIVVYLGSDLNPGITRGTPQLEIFTTDPIESFYRRPDFTSKIGTTFANTATIGPFDPAHPTNYASIEQLSPTAPVLLAANTEYWFLVSMVGTSSQQLEILGSGSASGPGYQGIIGSSNNGTTNFNVSSSNYLINIHAVAVPEPATYTILGGLLVLGAAVWRRRSAKTGTLTS